MNAATLREARCLAATLADSERTLARDLPSRLRRTGFVSTLRWLKVSKKDETLWKALAAYARLDAQQARSAPAPDLLRAYTRALALAEALRVVIQGDNRAAT